MSEPLVHVSMRALAALEHGDPGDLLSLLSPCGADLWAHEVQFIGAVATTYGTNETTPTCPKCRIAWDTAVEKAGGAR